jgi:hypothetical protein
MKKFIILTLLLISVQVFSQIRFDDYFDSKTLRVDYIEAGDFQSEDIFLQQVKVEPFWGGSKVNLIDKFNYGDYYLKVYDKKSKSLIYSRGYSTLFQEWQATDESKIVKRGFYETVIMPFPKNEIKIEIEKRDRKTGVFKKIFDYDIKPTNYFINPEVPSFQTNKVYYSGDPAKKLDIVFLPEGYAINEMEKFRKDVERFKGYLLECSPYKENKDKINIWSVEAPSEESGTDIPGEHIYKKTILNSSFYTFDVERYLMTLDVKSVRDLAGCVPYDQIVILVNTSKYGGGGVFNYYNVVTSDNQYSDYVLVHEFGHGFGGLGDEYWTSDVAVSDYYPAGIEPPEPNLTTLVNFESKWKNLVEKDVPIPTPNIEKYKNVVGVFEGGGYVAKGVYRPMLDCTMKSKTYNNFCVVCKNALIEMLKFYSE